MRLYTVHHRPDGNDLDPAKDPDVVFVKEGFCWPALFVPLIWLIYRKQVWGLLAYLAATAILSVVTLVIGMDDITIMLLSAVLSLYVAAQANDWRRWRLGTQGYDLITVVAANNMPQAEEIFFRERWQDQTIQQAVPPVRNFTPLSTSRLTPFATPFDPA